MAKGKKRECPRIIVVQAVKPKFNTRDEAWQVIGPVLARILAQTISVAKQEQKAENQRQRRSKAHAE